MADATENTDVVLLQERKILSAKFANLELESQERDRILNERWLKEEEERKRKQEEEEENKFDFSSFLMEKKAAAKKSTKQGFKNRGTGGASSSTNKNGGLASRQLKTQSSGIGDGGTGTKRKTGMAKR